MNRKSKLFFSLVSLCFSFAVLCFGVYSAMSVSYTIGGSVSYVINDVFADIETTVYLSTRDLPESRDNISTDVNSLYNNLKSGSIDQQLATLGMSKGSYIDTKSTYNEGDLSKETLTLKADNDIQINYGAYQENSSAYAYYIVIKVTNQAQSAIGASIVVDVPETLNTVHTATTSQLNISAKQDNVAGVEYFVVGMALNDPTISVSQSDNNFSLTLNLSKETIAGPMLSQVAYSPFVAEDSVLFAVDGYSEEFSTYYEFTAPISNTTIDPTGVVPGSQPVEMPLVLQTILIPSKFAGEPVNLMVQSSVEMAPMILLAPGTPTATEIYLSYYIIFEGTEEVGNFEPIEVFLGDGNTVSFIIPQALDGEQYVKFTLFLIYQYEGETNLTLSLPSSAGVTAQIKEEGKEYGEEFDAAQTIDLTNYSAKILRMKIDTSACPEIEYIEIKIQNHVGVIIAEGDDVAEDKIELVYMADAMGAAGNLLIGSTEVSGFNILLGFGMQVVDFKLPKQDGEISLLSLYFPQNPDQNPGQLIITPIEQTLSTGVEIGNEVNKTVPNIEFLEGENGGEYFGLMHFDVSNPNDLSTFNMTFSLDDVYQGDQCALIKTGNIVTSHTTLTNKDREYIIDCFAPDEDENFIMSSGNWLFTRSTYTTMLDDSIVVGSKLNSEVNFNVDISRFDILAYKQPISFYIILLFQASSLEYLKEATKNLTLTVQNAEYEILKYLKTDEGLIVSDIKAYRANDIDMLEIPTSYNGLPVVGLNLGRTFGRATSDLFEFEATVEAIHCGENIKYFYPNEEMNVRYFILDNYLAANTIEVPDLSQWGTLPVTDDYGTIKVKCDDINKITSEYLSKYCDYVQEGEYLVFTRNDTEISIA